MTAPSSSSSSSLQTMPSSSPNPPSQSSPKIHHYRSSSSSTTTTTSHNNNFFHRAKNTCRKSRSTACALLFFASLQVSWNARLSHLEGGIDVHPDPERYAASPSNTTRGTNRTSASSDHGLRAIVTGLEHSGTTLTGSLLINAPCIMGAFETGYLVASEPKHIQDAEPWYRWNSAATNTLDINYRLTEDDIYAMKASANFLDMYRTLRRRSYLFNELREETHCDSPSNMIDKTPRYVHPKYFEGVLKKTPGVPVVVTRKKFDRLAESWNRRETNLTMEFYRQTFENVYAMKIKYPNRILVIDEEDLMAYPEAIMMDVFRHVGEDMEWKTEYLQMEGLLRKFGNDTKTMRRIEQWKFSPGKHSPDRTD